MDIFTSNPTVNDDNTKGYAIGSVWFNSSTGNYFVCKSASTGAAVWSVTVAYVSTSAPATPIDGMLWWDTDDAADPIGAAGQLFLSAAGGTPSITAPCAEVIQNETGTNDLNYFSLDFNKTTDENAEWTVAMPSDWDAGTLTAQFYWTANDATTNSVVWGIKAVSLNDGDVMDTAFWTAVTVTDANASTAYQLRKSAVSGAITVGNTPSAGDLVQFKVYRDADNGSDTLDADAKLIGVMIAFGRA